MYLSYYSPVKPYHMALKLKKKKTCIKVLSINIAMAAFPRPKIDKLLLHGANFGLLPDFINKVLFNFIYLFIRICLLCK